jgi:O-antigen/teichoic acid export membrane protein
LQTVGINVTGQARSEDSLKRRYAYKLGANLFALPITVIIQSIVPRMLGPAIYGNYNFINNFFTQIVNFFDAGISAGFYSKLSQRQNEPGLIRYFWGVVSVVSTFVIILVLIVLTAGRVGTVWPNQEVRYVWMAAFWGLLTWCSQVINKTLDAYGLTVSAEIVRFQQKILGLALILLMFWLRRFSLTEFYLYQYAILLFLCVMWEVVLQRNCRTLFPKAKLSARQIKTYSREFYIYSAPLVVLGLVSLVGGVLDRWLLQKFAGSVQQGFFGLAYQVGSLCFLVSGAMTPLFWREIAQAFGDQNLPKMQRLFERTVRIMYIITAFLAVFIAFQAKNISLIIGGSDFKRAALPISIMIFYPIHQTYGQLTGSFLLGTGQTIISRNSGLITSVFGLLLSLWLMAPAKGFGLGLGATGLAIKMVVGQLFSVNLQLWFVTRFLKISFFKFIAHQVYSLAFFGGLALSSVQIISYVVQAPLQNFICSGLLYTISFAGFVLLFPSLVSISRTELRAQVTMAYHALLRR